MSRRIVVVTAERGTDWWVLETPEAGAVSQVERLGDAADEMREAVAHQLGIEAEDFDIDVRVVSSPRHRGGIGRSKEQE